MAVIVLIAVFVVTMAVIIGLGYRKKEPVGGALDIGSPVKIREAEPATQLRPVPGKRPVSVRAGEVELFTGGTDRAFRSLGEIEAKRSKGSLYSADPTLDEVNQELKQKAAAMGANAVLYVDYKRGMSLTSYGVLTARGEAIVLESDEKVCPKCAETIKRAAVVCRFCQADLSVA